MLATLILSCNLVAVCTNEHVYLFDMLSYFLLKINCGFGLFSDFSCKGMDAGRQLCNSDNPPNHPPRYPGKWSRNNLKGVTISKEEYLDQQIDEWLAYVSANPSYKVTNMANKARTLLGYLSLNGTFKRGDKNATLQCRDMIERAEARAEARATDENKENIDADVGQFHGEGTDENENEAKRVRRDLELQHLLDMPNKEMFADPNIQLFMDSVLVKNRLEEYGEEVCSQLTDKELLSLDESLKYVKETQAYKEWTETVPALTMSCLKFLKENPSELKKKERSELFVMDSLAETLDALRMNPSKESREQELVIAASLCSTEYGVPELAMHQRYMKEASEMKARLLSGQDEVLQRAERSPRQHFPPQVAVVAKNHWNEITITEPGKHQYVTKAMKDDGETVPIRLVFWFVLFWVWYILIPGNFSRWQTMTNEEAYQSFKETCTEEVRSLMAEHGRIMLQEVSKRPASRDKDYRIELARDKVPNRFPSQSWFLDKKPPEVKFCNDHATGLCKVSQEHLI